MEETDDINKAAEKASEAALEYEISKETRGFLNDLSSKKERNSSLRPLFLASIAASFLILIVSMITINLSHSNSSIASKYGINALVARTGASVNNNEFREAVEAYYSQDYQSSATFLEMLPEEDGKLSDYRDWLTLLIELQTQGSKSPKFKSLLDSITSNEGHEFYQQGLKMQADVHLFWRSLVVKK